MTTFDHIVHILVENLGVSREDIHLNAEIIKDLGADSLDVVELTMAIEEQCGVEIPDERVDHITTVQDMVRELDLLLKEEGKHL